MRSRRCFWSITFALALCMAASAAATLPHPHSHTIVPGRSIGGVRIGQSSGDARAAWGPGATCINKSEGTCAWITLHDGVADFTLHRGRVVDVSVAAGSRGASFDVDGPLKALRTSRGIGIGSTRDAVTGAYPGVRHSGAKLLLVADHRVTSFTIAAGRVTAVTVRRARPAG